MNYDMITTKPDADMAQKLVGLFTSSFGDSEGEDEGALIGKLVQDFLEMTDVTELQIAVALDGENLVGSAIFSRFYCADDTDAWLMAPVAVATDRQGTGIGQALISHAVRSLGAAKANLIITYGDINFYGKTGFIQISEDLVPAPLPLSYPHGWLGQTVNGKEIAPVKGPTQCVKAINDPLYW